MPIGAPLAFEVMPFADVDGEVVELFSEFRFTKQVWFDVKMLFAPLVGQAVVPLGAVDNPDEVPSVP
jgi:hypothetical protein